ncbi:hypothetical protein BDR26DRAFT_851896 [Obelidium mucronatum]|nr:hypothetical protein BDR26DRAFT_851896 [Obelidium mucronatum]
MSGKSFYAGAAPGGDTGFRKTWDKDEYAKKAREREENAGKKSKKDEKAKEPESLLKQREGAIDFSATVNKTQMVNAQGGAAGQGGFFCEACNITCKDNINWLDHLNGNKHLKNIGQSNKVARSTAEEVAARIALLTKKRKEPVQEFNLEERVTRAQEEEAAAKAARKEEKRRRKEEKKQEKQDAAQQEADVDVASLMGFGGFGTSKK